MPQKVQPPWRGSLCGRHPRKKVVVNISEWASAVVLFKRLLPFVLPKPVSWGFRNCRKVFRWPLCTPSDADLSAEGIQENSCAIISLTFFNFHHIELIKFLGVLSHLSYPRQILAGFGWLRPPTWGRRFEAVRWWNDDAWFLEETFWRFLWFFECEFKDSKLLFLLLLFVFRGCRGYRCLLVT